MTETDIISHYSALYLAQEQAEGRDAQPTDCYAIAGTDIWVWIEVVCEPKEAGSYRYVVGFRSVIDRHQRSNRATRTANLK